jgi:hypothetical protein
MTKATLITDDPRMVTALFMNRESAERAFVIAIDHGYDKGEISVVMDDDTRHKYFPAEEADKTELAGKAAEGGELGSPKSGTMATLFTAASAVGAFLLLPGLGLVLAGPVAAALAGAGAAAVAGGLYGALHDWGIPQERIEEYETAVKKGGILMGVKSRSREDNRFFDEQWKAAGAEHVYA